MEEKIEKPKKALFKSIFSGETTKERLENWSYLITIISGVLVAIGIGIGSFIQGTVLIASFGAFFFMVGIIIFIASQFMGDK
jgi:hypothetical protein